MDNALFHHKIVFIKRFVRISFIIIDQLRQMAIFSKTIDHGSFRGAAEALRLSPSVVSHHISQLEEHLGVALIYRSTRKLTLTREGERLLSAARKMLEAVEGELRDLSASASAPSGELRLTLPSVLSQSPLTNRIAAFITAYPRIQITLDFSDTRRDLIDDGFDVAIRMSPTAQTSATSRKLFQVERKIVASKAYLDGHTPATHPRDLDQFTWLGLSPVQNLPLTFQKPGGRPVNFAPRARLTVNDAQAMYRLAQAGAGMGIVPTFLAERDVAEGSMAYVLPEWELPTLSVFAVWPANAPKHGLIHLALNALGSDRKTLV